MTGQGLPLQIFQAEILSNFLRYAITAGGFYGLFWVWRTHPWRHRRLQAVCPRARQIWAEVGYSMSTVLVFSIVGLATTLAARAGHTQVYTDLSERGWAWAGVSTLLMILLHDAYFYWTHRWMHLPRVFRHVHRVHHASTSPTPWTAYSFHPLEALVQAAIFPLIVVLIPAHPIAIFAFLLYMIVRNVMGHLGFEVFAAGLVRNPLTHWHTTTTHHDLHHRNPGWNFGLYFSWWDALMGTTHREYPAVYAEVTGRARLASPRATGMGSSSDG